jgi:glycosyltransferase involved in cell wall biosynthesis
MDRPLRLAHVDAETGFSGGEVQVFLLMEGLRQRGHANVLFCPPRSRAAARALAQGFELREVPMRNDLDLRAVAALARGLRAFEPDLVHLHTGRATWLGGLAARRAGVPAITTRRMDRAVRPGLRTRLVYGRLVERAVAIAPAVAAALRAGGVPAEKIDTVWSAVEPARFAAAGGATELRGELGCPADATLFLSAGALVPRKGFDVLIEAFARLSAQHARLWIAGAGPERAALEQRLSALGLGERTRLLGQREDVPRLLAACDVFVLPSRREGLGVAALEAMAAGRPVVASRVGGLGEAVVDERTGLLVPPGDAAALAMALERLLGDAGLRARLGAAGPERIAAGHLPEQMVDAYERIYTGVLVARASQRP